MALIRTLTELIRPGGEPIAGRALKKEESIASLTQADLAGLIRKELGFERENKLIEKKITAASNPSTYYYSRKARQEALTDEIANFIKKFTEKLGDAGFTAEETGIVARHITNELGNVLKVTLEAEYPMEFVRKGLEDLLEKKYK